MELSSILKPEAVKVLNSVSSKKRLLQEISELADNVYGINAEASVAALNERENLGATGVGHGVSLPHCRLEGLEDVVGAFVFLEKPIDFGSVDRQPVDIAFTLFAPLDAGVLHLKSLALVSRTMRDKTVCSKLRANPDPAKQYAILTDAHSVQAA